MATKKNKKTAPARFDRRERIHVTLSQASLDQLRHAAESMAANYSTVIAAALRTFTEARAHGIAAESGELTVQFSQK